MPKVAKTQNQKQKFQLQTNCFVQKIVQLANLTQFDLPKQKSSKSKQECPKRWLHFQVLFQKSSKLELKPL